ncbi:MAG: hypothetical protein ABIH23_02190 [bacterium]
MDLHKPKSIRAFAPALFAVLSVSILACSIAHSASEVSIKKIEFEGWQNCYRMSNGKIDLIAVADVGPRILWFGFTGGENEFQVWEETLGKTGGLKWVPYGGHRLWIAPEAQPLTYFPDNVPVSVKMQSDTLVLTAPVERSSEFEGSSGVQKEMIIQMDSEDSVRVIHSITNHNPWTIDLALWALTFMKPGGKLIIPNPSYGPHSENLLPVRSFTVWKYTEMGDPQFHWGNRYIILKQDTTREKPNKIGVANVEGWAAYQRGEHLFVKYHEHNLDAIYPDMGCSLETFTNNETLEFETLGPMIKLAPGETGEHIERWRLFKGINATDDEDSIDREVTAKISK